MFKNIDPTLYNKFLIKLVKEISQSVHAILPTESNKIKWRKKLKKKFQDNAKGETASILWSRKNDPASKICETRDLSGSQLDRSTMNSQDGKSK